METTGERTSHAPLAGMKNPLARALLRRELPSRPNSAQPTDESYLTTLEKQVEELEHAVQYIGDRLDSATVLRKEFDGSVWFVEVQPYPLDYVSVFMRYTNWWEEWMLPIIRQLFQQRTGVVLDCGANIGTHTLIFSKTHSVWAFEPQPETFQILERNVHRNGCETTKCFNTALSDHTGTMCMSPLDVNNVGSRKVCADGTDLQAVSVSTLDKVMQSNGNPNVAFVKLDIEGHELQMLRGATAMLAQRPPILFEDHTGETAKWLSEMYTTVVRLHDADCLALNGTYG